MRTVNQAVVSDICATVSDLIRMVQDVRQESVVKISVHEQSFFEILSSMSPVIANICGKITHHIAKDIHTPGIHPYIVKQKNNFGIFDCVFTKFCNFHTGSNKTSTMFRAGTSREEINEAISHVFTMETIHDVLVNNIVYSSRLGHPVSRHNNGIKQALLALGIGSVKECMPLDDCMFVHCFLLQVQNEEWLAEAGVSDFTNMNVRINICRTGIVNFFFGIAGGVPLNSAPEQRLCAVCETLLQTIAKFV